MKILRNKVPSTLLLYNKFNQTYYRYFYGHYVKHINHVKHETYLQNFVDNHFHKLSYSIDKFEEYLLWLFAKYGKLPINSAFVYIDEFLDENKKSLDIIPFSVIISKYIREEGIKSWKEYLLPLDGFYPKIIQHYMRDKNFPFDFILFLKIIDRVPERQQKMLKAVFRNELYNIKDKMESVEKNKHFYTEEIRKINEEFK